MHLFFVKIQQPLLEISIQIRFPQKPLILRSLKALDIKTQKGNIKKFEIRQYIIF